MNHPSSKYHEDLKNSVGRLIFVVIACTIEVIWIILAVSFFKSHFRFVGLLLRLLSILVILRIFGKHINPNIRMSWIVFILAVPALGLTLYLLKTGFDFNNHISRKYMTIDKVLEQYRPDDEAVYQDMKKRNLPFLQNAYFLRSACGFPLFRNNQVRYYPEASEALEAQLEDLRQAEQYIFMEYHAIDDRAAFQRIKEVLVDRKNHGVLVRIFYDDIGSIGFINSWFIREMEEAGLECRVFNPITPLVNIFMDNRDHRKITVIDGRVGYTGGYNLADEYFNLIHPFGHWKDTGIRIEGAGVRTLTLLFLEMWNAISYTDQDISRFLLPVEEAETEQMQVQKPSSESAAFIQPYADSPLDEVHVGEDVYLNIIMKAEKYVYIITPYLIITDDMSRELTLAARRGVDVRIITPGIPDKKMIYQVTRSYYNALARDGVKIYEYTPGFCHAKMTLADDSAAVIGTINYDYRSFYHHFENGCALYGTDCIRDVRKDFDEMFTVCRDVTEKYRSGRSTALRIGQCLLRMFAPLM